MNKIKRLLILGASGAVGQEVLSLALAHSKIDQIIAPTRSSLGFKHARLENPIIKKLNQLPSDSSLFQVDAVICCLGTTMKKARTAKKFVAIDRDLVIQLANFCRQQGATIFALNSSLGAGPRKNLYLKTKYQAEEGVKALAYPSLTIIRPSLILAPRQELRLGEFCAGLFFKVMKPFIPSRYRAVRAEQIAARLLENILNAELGLKIIESEEI